MRQDRDQRLPDRPEPRAHAVSLYAYAIARALRILPGLMLAKLFCVLVLGWYATSLASAAYWTHADTWRFLLACPNFDVRDRLPGVFERKPRLVYGFRKTTRS